MQRVKLQVKDDNLFFIKLHACKDGNSALFVRRLEDYLSDLKTGFSLVLIIYCMIHNKLI